MKEADLGSLVVRGVLLREGVGALGQQLLIVGREHGFGVAALGSASRVHDRSVLVLQ
jgi:hypothetical protein